MYDDVMTNGFSSGTGGDDGGNDNSGGEASPIAGASTLGGGANNTNGNKDNQSGANSNKNGGNNQSESAAAAASSSSRDQKGGGANSAAAAAAPAITVELASSVAAHFLYVLSNQETDCQGLLYGQRRKRMRRDLNDHHDGFNSETYEENLSIRRFRVLGVGNTFYDNSLTVDEQIVKKCLKLPLEDSFDQNNQQLDLIGWFAFNRAFADCLLVPYAHVTKQLAQLAGDCQNGGTNFISDRHNRFLPDQQQTNMLFLSGFEREIECEFKMDVGEIMLRLHRYDFADDRLKSVPLRICNVGDTSHAEYATVVERQGPYVAASNFIAQPALLGYRPDELYQSARRLSEHAAYHIRQALTGTGGDSAPGPHSNFMPMPNNNFYLAPVPNNVVGVGVAAGQSRSSYSPPRRLSNSSGSTHIDLSSEEIRATFLEPSFLNTSDEMPNLRGQKRDKGDQSGSSSVTSDELEAGFRPSRSDTRKRSKNEETEIKSKGRGRKTGD